MTYSHIFPAFLLALASNLDNVGVGVAYGMRKVRVPLASNLLIAAITAIGTLASVLCGSSIGRLMSHGLATVLAGGLLIGMGIWVVAKEARSFSQPESGVGASTDILPVSGHGYLSTVHTIRIDPLSADSDRSGRIDLREAALLGLALTPNNLLNGAAAGIMSFSVGVIVILVFLFSLATLWAGIEVGEQCGKRWLGSIAGVASGALLIFVGTCELVI